tara:strand:- start:9482 stop:10111 length:630 start_codon:yes stop_codon:yes gene_type:complete
MNIQTQTLELLHKELQLKNHVDAIALLDKSIETAKTDEVFNQRFNAAFETGSTVEFRELFSEFGNYFKQSSESFPWYPHEDAVNAIDTAIHHVRLRSKQPLIDGYNCCTAGVLPDLTTSTSLEISAVFVGLFSDGSTDCTPLFGVASGVEKLSDYMSSSDIEGNVVYTVYHRDIYGYAEALHDSETLEQAKGVAEGIKTMYPQLSIDLN